MILLDELQSERLDERRLADTRRTADPDAHGTTRVREQRVEQLRRLFTVVGTRRLDEGDRPGEIASIASAHAVD
jgi:hypothetical protein